MACMSSRDLCFAPDIDALPQDFALIISRDVARVFDGDHRVDKIRLRIADVLRHYAHQDPDLGYTQGMCFAAAVVCLREEPFLANEGQFGSLMQSLRQLWAPGFPLLDQGMPELQTVLTLHDPELVDHLLKFVQLELSMIIPSAWLSVFAKWLPVDTLFDVVPFLAKEGRIGFIAVTYVILLAHRASLVELRTLDEVLSFVSSFISQPPPENLITMCELALPKLRADTVLYQDGSRSCFCRSRRN